MTSVLASAKNFPAGRVTLAPDAAGLFYEARVGEALGVPRKLIARLRTRHLVCGTAEDPGDFVRLKSQSNAVAFTARGLYRLEYLLAGGDGAESALPPSTARETPGKPPPTPPPDSSSAPSAAPTPPVLSSPADIPAGPPPREVMIVDRVPQYQGILLCRRSRPASLVCVRVRTNEFFVPGMAIECISGGGVWQFRNRAPDGKPGHESQCGRLPRRKGVW